MKPLETVSLIDDYRRAVAAYFLIEEERQRAGRREDELVLDYPAVIDMGMQLAANLERQGMDTKELRRFQRAVRTWQFQTASLLWEELDLDLEGIALRLRFGIGTKPLISVAADPPLESTKKERNRRKVGRPVDTDVAQDRRLYDAWQTGQYRTKVELADAFKLRVVEVRRGIDRVRKHRPKVSE